MRIEDWRDEDSIDCPSCAVSCLIVAIDEDSPTCGDPHMCGLDRDHAGDHVCDACGRRYSHAATR